MDTVHLDVLSILPPLADLLGDLDASAGAGAYLLLSLVLLLGACGLPVPEEAVFATAGALCARGALSVPLAFGIGWATVFVLDVALHGLGRLAGSRIRHARPLRGISPGRWRRARLFVRRRGVPAVASARFVMGTRIPVFILAGTLGMRRRVFMPTVAVAGLVTAAIPMWLGFRLGRDIEPLLEALAAARLYILGGAAVVVLLAWVYLRGRRQNGSRRG